MNIINDIEDWVEDTDKVVSTALNVGSTVIKTANKRVRKLERKVREHSERFAQPIVNSKTFERASKRIINKELTKNKEVIAKLVTNTVYDAELNKNKERSNHVYNMQQYNIVNELDSLESADTFTEKYAQPVTEFITFNLDTLSFVIRKRISDKKTDDRKFNLGKSITITHVKDNTFSIKSELGTFVYDNNYGKIINFDLV